MHDGAVVWRWGLLLNLLLLNLLVLDLLVSLKRLLRLKVTFLLGELFPVVRQVDHRVGAVRSAGGHRVETHRLTFDLLLEHRCHNVRLLGMGQRLLRLLGGVQRLGCLLVWEQSQVALDKLLISCVPIHLHSQRKELAVCSQAKAPGDRCARACVYKRGQARQQRAMRGAKSAPTHVRLEAARARSAR